MDWFVLRAGARAVQIDDVQVLAPPTSENRRPTARRVVAVFRGPGEITFEQPDALALLQVDRRNNPHDRSSPESSADSSGAGCR